MNAMALIVIAVIVFFILSAFVVFVFSKADNYYRHAHIGEDYDPGEDY